MKLSEYLKLTGAIALINSRPFIWFHSQKSIIHETNESIENSIIISEELGETYSNFNSFQDLQYVISYFELNGTVVVQAMPLNSNFFFLIFFFYDKHWVNELSNVSIYFKHKRFVSKIPRARREQMKERKKNILIKYWRIFAISNRDLIGIQIFFTITFNQWRNCEKYSKRHRTNIPMCIVACVCIEKRKKKHSQNLFIHGVSFS